MFKCDDNYNFKQRRGTDDAQTQKSIKCLENKATLYKHYFTHNKNEDNRH